MINTSSQMKHVHSLSSNALILLFRSLSNFIRCSYCWFAIFCISCITRTCFSSASRHSAAYFWNHAGGSLSALRFLGSFFLSFGLMALGALAVVATLQLLGTCAAVSSGIRLQVMFAGAVPTSTAGGSFAGSSAYSDSKNCK